MSSTATRARPASSEVDAAALVAKVRRCLCRRVRRLGMQRLQDDDLDDLTQEVTCNVLTSISKHRYTAAGLHSLIWLACRSALVNWIEARTRLALSDALELVPQYVSEQEPLPGCFVRLAGDLGIVALALSKGLPKEATAQMLGISRAALYRHVETLRKRLALFAE